MAIITAISNSRAGPIGLEYFFDVITVWIIIYFSYSEKIDSSNVTVPTFTNPAPTNLNKPISKLYSLGDTPLSERW